MELVRSSDSEAIRGADFAVRAAGALVWRVNGAGLEVLMIHRERYDDWSWPKGKINPGETMPECATREVLEEIGLDITLGIPLPAMRYEVNSGPKVVYYWAARSPGTTPVPDGKEVDAVRWATPELARTWLTNPGDLEPLDALVAAHQAGELFTVPFVVIRHAKAKPRSNWTREEGKRPLAATGQRQALAVSRLVTSWRPTRVASSPWIRCVQTVTPYLKEQHLPLKLLGSITEHEAKRHPGKAMRAVAKLLNKHRSQAMCTHRPVLPLVLEELRKRMSSRLRAFLPAEDPFLRPGSIIVVHQPVSGKGKLVSVEVYEAFED
ncbi:NUDIX hydrolase [Paeniglutamicibacter terrestris]|uniref:NUDIX hydrolase n=1 Tax=Paeniglutamicibacter terrestris TaxID=2723403 RepID=A0ABX1G1Y1_9MICC|nr:NUDIX hydrolase [Arthrobacter sp. 7749]NKG20245.1 NUDIX hydrolase [Paeniglutamicibacter terrestris]